jgi:transposase-like protein
MTTAPTLNLLRRTVARRDQADADVRALAVSLAAAHVPISHIAEAAGVARPTDYAWIREAEHHV